MVLRISTVVQLSEGANWGSADPRCHAADFHKKRNEMGYIKHLIGRTWFKAKPV